jgi:hypothetical protein
MMTVKLYAYEEPPLLAEDDKAPPKALHRILWFFEIRCEIGIKGIEIRLRSVFWQSRTTARHKWTSDRAWYWSTNDIGGRHGLPGDYLVMQRPGVPAEIESQALLLVREMVHFESEKVR